MDVQLLKPPTELLHFATQTVPADLAAELLPPDLPLALLPVRLETRFFAQPDGSQELRIRIFPDQIHIDSHEPELSDDELTWGKHFWELTWRAADDEARRRLAWQQLADHFDAQRAAWIARALQPVNMQAKPAAPLADDAPLDPVPKFPDVALKDDAGGWQRAPLARLMPQRWIAIARANGAAVGHAFGTPIAAPPALGPDPKAAPESSPDDTPSVDAGMRWMVDFAEAERIGMALRMSLPAATAQAGLDALVVFGVASALDADASAASLAALLDAHHYTNGCAFVQPGTPSNNTEDLASGLDTADPLRASSFEAEWQHFGESLGTQSNAAVLAAALGFAGEAATLTLGSLPNASTADALDAQQMAAALWTPTWGYYLANLVGLGDTGLTPDDIDWAREHFISYLRAAGPLPFLRAGRQPYGLLPVTILGDWAAPAGEDAAARARDLWLKQLLLQLRDALWRPRLPDVPCVGRSTDPAQDLAAVLRTDGIANSYRVRNLLGAQYLQHLHSFLGEDLAARGWNAAHDALTSAVLAQLGFIWRPRLAGAAYDERDRALSAPLVQAGTDAQPAALAPNYIAALLAAPPLPLAETDPLPSPPEPAVLLHVLLRHALQLEYAWAAARLVSAQPNGPALASLLRDIELVNLGASTATTWRMLLGRSSPATQGQTPAQFLTALTSFDGALAPLGRFREALAHLATLDAQTLERLLVGTLDVASHRLDAWITSFSTKRLAEMRADHPTGLYVGAYGWVENLKPAPAQQPLPTPAGETGPVFALANDAGFIHAPSIAQAQTAALLRNAHLTHARDDAPNLFAVDLSSRRVRIANQLLDGVRQGQPLGALLGYRFERGLHERGLDDAIDDFRALAPLLASNAPASAQSAESVAAANVVDGLKLFDLYEPQRASPSPLFARCAAVLDELGDAIDALADALVAETAHQAVRGNTARAASTLQAIAAGTQAPPELEVARTPRSGIAVTHRAVVLLPDKITAPSGWPTLSRSPRASAEPRLDAWAARLLGPAKQVRLTVERLLSDAVTATHTLHLFDLGLRPLDVIALAATKPGGVTPQLDALVLDATRTQFGAEALGETLRLDPQRASDWKANESSLSDLRELAARAQLLIGSARALDARDVQALQDPGDSGIDAAEIETRAKKAAGSLAAATKSLAKVAAQSAPDVAALRTALAKLAAYGIGSALPPPAGIANDASALSVLAALAAREAQQRVDACNALAAAPGADAFQRASIAARQLAAVFGAGFVALPRFTLAGGTELKASLDATEALQGGDALAVLPWFARMQRVREGVARLGASLHAAEATGTGERMNLAVAQLPHTDGARWVGLPETPAQPIKAGCLSLIVQTPVAVDATQAMAGLMIDEWVEVIPSRSETTGIVFQHDAPDSRAPQAILLAVPPVPGTAWTAWNLHRLLLETLDAAKLRAVDAEALDNAALNPVTGAQAVGEISHFLPALYFAVNVDGDAISPDFGPLT